MRRFMFSAVFLFSLASTAQAQTVSYTETGGNGVGWVGSNTGSRSITATVPGFDTTRGTLKRVDVAYSTNFQIGGAVDSVHWPWDATATSTSTVTASYGTAGAFSDSYTANQSYNGLSSFIPYAFGPFNVIQPPAPITKTLKSGTDFTSFASGSSTTFNILLTNSFSTDADIGNGSWFTYVTCTVTYTYLPTGQLSYNSTGSQASLGWVASGNSATASIGILGFNTTLGTLTQVDVTMNTFFKMHGSVTSATAPWSGSLTSISTAGATYGSESLTDSYSVSQSYAPGLPAGTYTFAPAAGGNRTGVSNTYTSGSVFDDFAAGTGLSATASISNTASGTVPSYVSNFFARATFYVTYSYIPAP